MEKKINNLVSACIKDCNFVVFYKDTDKFELEEYIKSLKLGIEFWTISKKPKTAELFSYLKSLPFKTDFVDLFICMGPMSEEDVKEVARCIGYKKRGLFNLDDEINLDKYFDIQRFSFEGTTFQLCTKKCKQP